MSIRVTAAEFPAAVAEGLVVVDFYSDSCGPCKRLSPILAELEESGAFKLVKVNIVYEQALAQQFEILAAPTLIIFQDGKEQSRLRGAVRKEEILSALEQVGKD